MGRECALTLAELLFAAAAASAQATVRVDSIDASSLGHRAGFQIILPSGYDSTQRYPVLWLLHGWREDDHHWVDRTRLLQFVEPYPLIVVLPNADTSWYVDAPGDTSARYETFIMKELPAFVSARYGVDSSRQAIAGVSMGGYGAAMLALRHPSHYRFVGALSPPIAIPGLLADTTIDLGVFAPSLWHAFGRSAGAQWTTHDVFSLLQQDARAVPYFFVAVAEDDQFRVILPSSRAFTDSLRKFGIPYEYHEGQGGHRWAFWNNQLAPMLARAWREVTGLRR